MTQSDPRGAPRVARADQPGSGNWTCGRKRQAFLVGRTQPSRVTVRPMTRFSLATLATVIAVAGAAASAASGAPITKQNGSAPVFNSFTSICSVPGYVNYGNCNGDPTTYHKVTGNINAVQAKAGRWNLGLAFTNLEPGKTYRLWGNQDPTPPSPGVIGSFFVIGTTVAGLDGTARFSYQTT